MTYYCVLRIEILFFGVCLRDLPKHTARRNRNRDLRRCTHFQLETFHCATIERLFLKLNTEIINEIRMNRMYRTYTNIFSHIATECECRFWHSCIVVLNIPTIESFCLRDCVRPQRQSAACKNLCVAHYKACCNCNLPFYSANKGFFVLQNY